MLDARAQQVAGARRRRGAAAIGGAVALVVVSAPSFAREHSRAAQCRGDRERCAPRGESAEHHHGGAAARRAAIGRRRCRDDVIRG